MQDTSQLSSRLVLEDGTEFKGKPFGYASSIAGEVVFNTGMVGYPEALTDPSYSGQILTLTYPLIGNYGIPAERRVKNLDTAFESDRVQIAGLIVSEFPADHHHWSATRSLNQWLFEQRVPALAGIDTRCLTKLLRDHGSMLGKILLGEDELSFRNPNEENLVARVSVPEPIVYAGGKKRVVVVDGGCKHSILRSLMARGATVIRVPWDYDFLDEKFDGILISNGPGNPKMCSRTIDHIERAMSLGKPIFGLCLGHQLLALAAGADTYKLKFGHRGQNQPCSAVGTKRCYITSQNHGYAVNGDKLPQGWEPWFANSNDGSNEGIRHRSRPFMSVQFHPEAAPGPVDTNFLFDQFVDLL